MKKSPIIIILLAFLVGYGLGYEFAPDSDKVLNPPIRACFSPEGKCTNLIVSSINRAQKSIYVMAYSFTSEPIAQALNAAHLRGVDVKVLIDKSQESEKYSQLNFLAEHKIPIYIDVVSGIAHNKVMIFDGRYVLTGSFNFSKAAESRNAENIVIIDDGSLASTYTKNWEERAEKARSY